MGSKMMQNVLGFIKRFINESLAISLLFLTLFSSVDGVNHYINDAVIEIIDDADESESRAPEKDIEKRPENDLFRLKIGDRLALQIYGDQNSLQDVEIDSSGSINYLVVNTFPAAGMTVPEFTEAMQNKLREYFRDVTLAVTLKENLGDFYVILGEVYKPGTKPIVGNATILTAIAEAGGTSLREFRKRMEDLADFDKAFLSRNGEYVPIDFRRLIKNGDLSQDVPLKNGDYIYIPSLEYPEVYVIGEVKKPSLLRYVRTITLLEALSRSGGMTLTASSRVAVLRGSLCHPKKFLIDYNLIVTARAPDFWLLPGDVVYVPPRVFTTAVDIFKYGVRAFVANMFSWMGNRLLIQFEPGAAGLTGNSTTFPISPVGP